MMKIAFDVTPTCSVHRSGVGRYVVSLADALCAAGADLRPWCRLSRWRKRGLVHRPTGTGLNWFQGRAWPLWTGCDVVHGTDVRTPARRCARVATIHDVFHLLPDSARWSTPAFAKRARRHYAEAVALNHLLIAVSESTRQDLIRLLGADPARVVAIPHGIDPRFAPCAAEALRARLKLPPRYVLFVGALAIRKNVPGLIRAWAASRLSEDHALVLAGQPSDDAEAVAAAIRDHARGAGVIRLDYVADADLPALYSGAAVFAFPSFGEGFGLPVLEAMACGVPVATSAAGSLAEVAAGHGVTAAPQDPQAFARALEQAAALPSSARAAARAHAASFTWAATAQQTITAYALALRIATNHQPPTTNH
jgi:glycosyltransferase involved in cell wall biosynthesis